MDPDISYFYATDYTIPAILQSPIYSVAFDTNYRSQRIVHQLGYYFSVSNLCKDLYLRKLIDANGGIKLTELIKFNRLKILTNNGNDIDLLTNVINDNKSRLGVELINNQTAVRLVNWKQWILNPH
jgi:la-related protein 1